MTNTADDTRCRLLESAGEVFAEKGFRAATVRDICNRAEANLAAVNYHFGDKERLYVEAVKHAHHCGEEVRPPEWPPGMPLEAKLREYIHQMLTQMLDDRRPAWHAQLMAREMTEPTKACAALVESYIRSNFELLDQILAELLPAETSSADRHLVAFSIVGQCLYFKIGRPIVAQLVGEEEFKTHQVARLTDHVAKFTLAALGREKPVYRSDRSSSTTVQP